MPPSGSEAVAVQVSAVLVVTPVAGAMVTLSTVGAEFSTATETMLESVPLKPSSATTVQEMVSPGTTVVGVRVSVAPAPSAAPEPFAQLYVSVAVSPSASVAVAKHVSVVSVLMPVAGVI